MNLIRRAVNRRGPLRGWRPTALLLCAGALLAGCASADKTTPSSTSTGTHSTSSSAMVGMNMGGGSGATQTSGIKGIKPVPTQVLASANWQGMRITAQAMTAVPFVIYNGTTEKVVKPGHSSFHLMVMLSDAQTHVPIPYASVWATIEKGGRIISDERQWPMISRYMGPHYGNDVTVPGAGTYKLSLLISPPVSARHMEYANVWTKPHRVNFTFHWKPAS